MSKRRRPERIALRPVAATVDGKPVGALIAADGLSSSRLRAKKFRRDGIVFAELKQPRSPGFHRLAHMFGMLVADNIEAFEGMDCHSVLKRLQVESGQGCDEVAVILEGLPVMYRIPRSLSFESMDEGEFHEVFGGLCKHVAKRYWPTCTPEEIADMARCMADAA